MSADDNNQSKVLLDRIVATLKKLGQRGQAVHEGLSEYRGSQFDSDSDSDSDNDSDSDTDTDTDWLANDTQADKLFNIFLPRYQAIKP